MYSVLPSLAAGYERCSSYKVVGLVVAVSGAVFMVLMGLDLSELDAAMKGHIFFFINCSASAWYILLTKPLLKDYHSIVITAMSYMFW